MLQNICTVKNGIALILDELLLLQSASFVFQESLEPRCVVASETVKI